MSVGQNRVAIVVLVRSENIPAAADRYGMLRTGAALRVHNIVILTPLVDMRSFRPGHLLHGTVPHVVNLTDEFKLLDVYLLDPDIVITVVGIPLRIGMRADIIAPAVLIKEQAGIDSVCTLQIVRLRPGSCRIVGCDDIIAAEGYVGTDHIVRTVVVSHGRCKQTCGMSCIRQRQLRLSVHSVADLLPVHQISAVHDGKSGEIGKCGIDQIVISVYCQEGGVRIKTGHNGIFCNN